MTRDDGGAVFGSSFQIGMSLRDLFPMEAMKALGGHKAVTSRGIPWLVEHAYMVADAMLVERDKRREAGK
jgi:hypothetical protein